MRRVVITQGGETMRRVVITGMGVISPLGNTVEAFWDRINLRAFCSKVAQGHHSL